MKIQLYSVPLFYRVKDDGVKSVCKKGLWHIFGKLPSEITVTLRTKNPRRPGFRKLIFKSVHALLDSRRFYHYIVVYEGHFFDLMSAISHHIRDGLYPLSDEFEAWVKID